ncbi:uncharacterized protein LOC129742267 [Uranotaenia lowii]|uniref:uncharacterized protein LOC129742267 n=1 Tax=Uranotaenia lowii TaxID=190385 RepID=UPI0024798A62|nr:uncharacterized protein LOC129742267 [Uranotaenia lowii]
MFSFLIGVCLLASYAESSQFKSLDRSIAECAKYAQHPERSLDDVTLYPKTERFSDLIHCSGLVLKVCNNEKGALPHVVGNYFHPDPEDSCFKDRYNNCRQVARVGLCPGDFEGRAYADFTCLYENYGTMQRGPQFVPASDLQEQQYVREVFRIFQVPEQVLKDYSEGKFEQLVLTERLIRSFLIKTKLYSDVNGFDILKISNEDENGKYISEESKNCLQEDKSKLIENRSINY